MLARFKKIERVFFTALSHRRRGACLDYQSRVAVFQTVTASRMRDMADVKMASEKYVRPARDQTWHHFTGTADNIVLVKTFRQIERMMGDDHFHFHFIGCVKFLF